MNRIDFFKRMLLGGASLLTAKYAGANAGNKTADIYLNSPYIAGFQYYKGPETEAYLKENETLNLKREAENKHDFFAVEVFWRNNKLGYLPRTDNKIIARMIDQGVTLKAKIRSLDPEAHPFRRVKIRVFSEMG